MSVFFDGWMSLGRTLVAGAVAYAALVTFLRLSGKRTLSKMNAFDLVVTVALGSTLSTILVSRQTPLADGLLALGLLILLQYLVAWLAVRSPAFERLVKSEPTLLVLRGRLQHAAVKRQRVVIGEVLAAVRSAGLARLEDAGLVVLETDGSFSVVPNERVPAPTPAGELSAATAWQGD